MIRDSPVRRVFERMGTVKISRSCAVFGIVDFSLSWHFAFEISISCRWSIVNRTPSSFSFCVVVFWYWMSCFSPCFHKKTCYNKDEREEFLEKMFSLGTYFEKKASRTIDFLTKKEIFAYGRYGNKRCCLQIGRDTGNRKEMMQRTKDFFSASAEQKESTWHIQKIQFPLQQTVNNRSKKWKY